MRIVPLLCLVFLAQITSGTCEAVVIEHATLYPATGSVISDGTIVITDGKISDIGTAVNKPAGARIIDGRVHWRHWRH